MYGHCTEKPEEMETMEKDKRKERNEGKQVSDQTNLQCTQPACMVAILQPKL